MKTPLISIVLSTLNAMPQIKECIERVKRQSYRHFELVVQDGASKDGTLEHLQSLTDLPRVDIQSAADSGISQGYNRALERCRGDLLFFLGADEFLFEHSLETAVSWFSANPTAAVIYGGMVLVNKDGVEQMRIAPSQFELLKLISCELVPPVSATVFNLAVLTLEELKLDESMSTCMDYDLWLKLGSRHENQIFTSREIFCSALNDRTSMSYRAEVFSQMCKDKCSSLDRWLQPQGNEPAVQLLRRIGMAGIYLWGAEQTVSLEGTSLQSLDLVKLAASLQPRSSRLQQLLRKFSRTSIETLLLELPQLRKELELELVPPAGLRMQNGALSLQSLLCHEHWDSRLTAFEGYLRLEGRPQKWGYIAEAHVCPLFCGDMDYSRGMDYFISVKLKVLSGIIGVCIMKGKEIDKEYVSSAENGEVEAFGKIDSFSDFSVILRNSGQAGSAVEVYELSLLASKGA